MKKHDEKSEMPKDEMKHSKGFLKKAMKMKSGKGMKK